MALITLKGGKKYFGEECLFESLDFHIVFTLIILNAIPSVFGYFLQAKYRVLMMVDGRRYIITNSETMLQLLSNAGKILVLFRNGYIFKLGAVSK